MGSSGKRRAGRMLREYFWSFARTGVPESSLGATWDPVDPSSGHMALPLLRMRLTEGGGAMSREAWFSNTTASMLADIRCGRVEVRSGSGSSCQLDLVTTTTTTSTTSTSTTVTTSTSTTSATAPESSGAEVEGETDQGAPMRP